MPQPSRRKAREVALQTIYSRSRFKLIAETEFLITKESKLSKKHQEFAESLISKTWNNLDNIDQAITKNLKHWKQTRLSETLNALLRIGSCELLYFPDTDAKIVLNESIELCKCYVGDKATKLCNGVLHAIWQESQEQK